MLLAFTSALAGGLTSGALVLLLGRAPVQQLRTSVASLGTRINELDKVPAALIEKRIVPLEQAVNQLVERLAQAPTRAEVGAAFLKVGEIEEARRQQQVQHAEQERAALAQAELELVGAKMEIERQQAAMQEWADQQRVLIRREVEQELAEEMARRQQSAVLQNPLNARPAAPGVAPPAGFDEVVRRRFARPELAPIPDPFEAGIPES